MPNTYQEALAQIRSFYADGIRPGILAGTPTFDANPLLLVNFAIDSENLSVHAILFEPGSGAQISCDPHKLLGRKKSLPDKEYAGILERLESSLRYFNGKKNPAAFEYRAQPDPEMISGQVLRHFKGGTYTAFSVLGPESKEAKIVYISHKDGTWWIRPWAEFERTRFQASEETPLTIDEAGMDFIHAKEKLSSVA